MKVLDLRCIDGHTFEGWFGSEDDFSAQLSKDDVACPLCASTSIVRLPSAPRLQVGRHAAPADTRASPGPTATASSMPATMTLQSQWLRAVQHVMTTTEDVGDRFAEEARRIHYGEVEERAIRGRATPRDAEALRDEGIEVVSLPLPDAMKGSLQ
ncbi:MAG: DUF1178 family protein [Pseudomonadota bacterium]|nr:DUF1178 family protein [Pseudomonadota bacterium]